MTESYEFIQENGSNVLATNRKFTDSEVGIRPKVPTFERDLKRLLEVIQDISPEKEFFLAQRLKHNSKCKLIENGDLTRDWSKEPNTCYPFLVRTVEAYDSIIFPKKGIDVNDSFGNIHISAENMVGLTMPADCPSILIDAGQYIALIHASLKTLCNYTDGSSGLERALNILRHDLHIKGADIKATSSHSIGPELFDIQLSHQKWGEEPDYLNDDLMSKFDVNEDGSIYIDIMEIIREQLIRNELLEENIYLDKRCVASVVDNNGKFLFPSHTRRDVKDERSAVARWI